MTVPLVPGQSAPQEILLDVGYLLDQYVDRRPDVSNPHERVSFGTSGHRGSSTLGTFNEWHIAAITQAICEYRRQAKTTGPLMLGKDTHALSGPAQHTALEVLVANEVPTLVQSDDGFTPTPAISRQILDYNRGRADGLADGIVITPSHNPPPDGGFKYNPTHGGPADSDVTRWIQDRANQLLAEKLTHVKRTSLGPLLAEPLVTLTDFIGPYVEDLAQVIDFAVIQQSQLKIGVDPLGGASVAYWGRVAERYRLNLTVVNERVDPQFGFMPLDHDGKIRMDCSSPYAMASLVQLKDDYDVAFGLDPDADRHGIVTRSAGLLNPNHYLAAAIEYLFTQRHEWPRDAAVGKTAVSSAMIDRVARALGRAVVEVPVGFKWFVDGLYTGRFGFAGEESAGASFLRRDGTVWSTDKDGLILGLLAAEMTARTQSDPGQRYRTLTQRFGDPCYRRLDQPATPHQKAALSNMTPELVSAATLAGDPIVDKQTRATGNGAALGGLKVATAEGWFAARPSGTEDIYKVYAESFRGPQHLQQIIDEAKEIVDLALGF